jgi:thioredoxin-related protein
VTLRALLESSRPLLLVFADPGCGPCNALLPEVARWQREQSSILNIVLVSSGDIEVNREKAREYGLTQVLLQKEREVATAFRYAGTPSAVLIGADGLIASPVVAGADALRGLFTRTVRQSNAVKSMQHPPVVRAAI